MKYDYHKAKEAGFSDDEILDELQTKIPEYNVGKALQSGLSKEEVITYLSGNSEKPEKMLTSWERTKNQLFLGAAKAFTWPMDLLAAGELAESRVAFEELQERLPELKKQYPDIDWDSKMDPKKFEAAFSTVAKYSPTQQGAETIIEEQTGLPLSAKTKEQHLLRLAGEAAGFTPGSLLRKGSAAVAAPTLTSFLTPLGIPEPLADTIALLVSTIGASLGGAGGKMVSKLEEGTSKTSIKAAEAAEEALAKTAVKSAEDAIAKTPPIAPKSEAITSTTDKLRAIQKQMNEITLEIEGQQGKALSAEPESIAKTSVKEIVNEGQRFESKAKAGEEIGKLVKGKLTQKSGPHSRVPRDKPSEVPPEPLKGRVKVSNEELGIKPHTEAPKTASEEIGESLSKKRIYNETQAGQALKKEVMERDAAVYEEVNKLYRAAEEAQEGAETIHPRLVSQLEEKLEEIRQIPSPSGPQKQLIRTVEDVLERLVAKDADGTISGYRPIKTQSLIEQVQSIRQKLNYDFAHGQPTGIFKPVIKELLEAVETNSSPLAKAALDKANKAYREWKATFGSDYIRPMRDRANLDHTKLARSMRDIDEFVQARKILEQTKHGRELERAFLRDLVEKKLEPILKNPRAHTPAQIEQVIRELEAVLTPAEAQAVRNQIEKARGRRFKATHQAETPAKTPHELTGKTDAQLSKMAESLEGLKQLETALGKTKEGQKLLARLKEDAGIDRLYKGKVTPPSSQSILDTLSNREDLAYLVATLGRERVDLLREVAQLSQRQQGALGRYQAQVELKIKSLQKSKDTIAKRLGEERKTLAAQKKKALEARDKKKLAALDIARKRLASVEEAALDRLAAAERERRQHWLALDLLKNMHPRQAARAAWENSLLPIAEKYLLSLEGLRTARRLLRQGVNNVAITAQEAKTLGIVLPPRADTDAGG